MQLITEDWLESNGWYCDYRSYSNPDIGFNLIRLGTTCIAWYYYEDREFGAIYTRDDLRRIIEALYPPAPAPISLEGCREV